MRLLLSTLFCLSMFLCARADESLELISRTLVLSGSADNTGIETLDIRICVHNKSDRDVLIPTGSILKRTAKPEMIFLYAEADRLNSAIPLKPGLVEMNLINLRPGETALLGNFRLEMKAGDADRTKIAYIVDDSLKQFYDIWTGKLQSTLKDAEILSRPRK